MDSFKKAVSWPSFAVALGVYIVCLSVTSRVTVPLASRGFAYGPASIDVSPSIWTSLYLVVSLPQAAAYAMLVLCTLTAQFSLIKTPPAASNLLLLPVVFGLAAVVELVFLVFAAQFSASVIFLAPATLFNLVKNVAGALQTLAVGVLLPQSAQEWTTSIGREGRQRIKKN